jgi:hypothetical protein
MDAMVQATTSNTLASLGRGVSLIGRCRHYDRSFLMSVPVLIRRLGPDFPMAVALKRITCKECGAKAASVRMTAKAA